MLSKDVHNILGSLTLAIRITGTRHAFVNLRLVYQPLAPMHYFVTTGTHQLHRTCLHRLGALRGIAHHQDRLTQSRCLFLNAPTVGQHKSAVLHQINKGQVFERRNQVNVRQILQQRINRLLYIGIQMYRINHLPTGMRLRDLTNGSTDFLKTLSEIFPPVSGNQHVASRLRSEERRVGKECRTWCWMYPEEEY